MYTHFAKSVGIESAGIKRWSYVDLRTDNWFQKLGGGLFLEETTELAQSSLAIIPSACFFTIFEITKTAAEEQAKIVGRAFQASSAQVVSTSIQTTIAVVYVLRDFNTLSINIFAHVNQSN